MELHREAMSFRLLAQDHTDPQGASHVRPLPSNNHHHEAGHQRCVSPECQTLRWGEQGQEDPAGGWRERGREEGRICWTVRVLWPTCPTTWWTSLFPNTVRPDMTEFTS
ncbi:hypothetical protein INR49_022451 [Caranx melampygus]|nr:hypothetical protein INR49_022451 [Caranx melampygus]